VTGLWIAVLSAAIGGLLALGSAVSLKAALALALLIPGMAAAAVWPWPAVRALFILGVVLIDFGPASVYRYFLVSDVLLLAACAIQLWVARRATVYFPALVTAILGLYLLGLLIGLAAAQDLTGLSNWLHFAALVFVLLPAMTTLFVQRPELKRDLIVAIVVTAVVQALMIVAAVMNGLEWRYGTRITGAMGSVAVWVFAAAAVAAAGALLLPSWPARIAGAASLAVLALAETFLKSRMLWIATAVGIGAMVLMQSRHRRLVALAVAATAALLVAGYAADVYPPAIATRISETLRPTESADLVARIQVVQDLIGAVEESDAIGIGPGQSESYLRRHRSSSPVVNIHNVILHATVEGGALAGASLVMMPIGIAALWLAAWRRHADPVHRFITNWTVTTLAAIYIAAQLTPALYEHTFYVLLAALASEAAAAVPLRA
jgi:O-antigen ligase